MSEIYDQIVAQHRDLEEDYLHLDILEDFTKDADLDPEKDKKIEAFVERVKVFTRQAREAGTNVTDVEQRDQLRKVIRQWAAFIYEQTGEYPPVQLAPVSETGAKGGVTALLRSIKDASTFSILVGIVVVILVVGASIRVGCSSQLNEPTLTPLPTPTFTPVSTLTLTPSTTLTSTPTSTRHPAPTTECPLLVPPLVTGSLSGIEAEIISPRDCDEIVFQPGSPVYKVEIEGIYSGDLDNMQLWVLVYPHRDKLFYPQAVNACKGDVTTVKQDKGLWNTTAYLGQRRNRNEYFDIIITAVETKSEVHGLLEDWLADVCLDWDIPGITLQKLRESAGLLQELDTITVQTR